MVFVPAHSLPFHEVVWCHAKHCSTRASDLHGRGGVETERVSGVDATPRTDQRATRSDNQRPAPAFRAGLRRRY